MGTKEPLATGREGRYLSLTLFARLTHVRRTAIVGVAVAGFLAAWLGSAVPARADACASVTGTYGTTATLCITGLTPEGGTVVSPAPGTTRTSVPIPIRYQRTRCPAFIVSPGRLPYE